jgi:ABC-type nitrate/sulfonate/bicarbonate transport system substrate-binding protein
MNKERRNLCTALAAAAGVAVVPGVAATWSRSAHAQPANGGAAVSIGVLRNVPGSLISAATEEGYFKRAGVDVTLPSKFLSGGGPALLPAVVAGSADLGVIGDTPAILALGRGDLPFDIIGAVSETSRVFTVVAPVGVTSLKDLRGKKIGLPTGTSFEYFLAKALEHSGMKLADVEVVNLSQAQALPAFLSSRIDAVLPDNFGLQTLLRSSGGAHVVFNSDRDFGGPEQQVFRQFNVFVAGRGAVQKNRSAVQTFLKTYYTDVTGLVNSAVTRAKTVEAMTGFLNVGVKNVVSSADLMRQVELSGFPDLAGARLLESGGLNRALTAQAQFWKQAGRISRVPDFADASVGSLLV